MLAGVTSPLHSLRANCGANAEFEAVCCRKVRKSSAKADHFIPDSLRFNSSDDLVCRPTKHPKNLAKPRKRRIRQPQESPELLGPAKTLNSFLQPKKAGRIVIQDISFLFRRKFGIGLNGVNRHRDCIGPDHFVGTEHDALLESRVN